MSVIMGTNLADAIFVGSEPSTVFGGDGNDAIFGGAGNDILWGEGGSDILIGGDGDDMIRGGSSQNVVAGNDVLFGGAGNDWLSGGDETQTLIGGSGADVFESRGSAFGEGVDVVIDFEDGVDKIAIQGGSADSVVTYDSMTGLVSLDGVAFMQLDAGLEIDSNDYFIS